jgi:hypothetical protein
MLELRDDVGLRVRRAPLAVEGREGNEAEAKEIEGLKGSKGRGNDVPPFRRTKYH